MRVLLIAPPTAAVYGNYKRLYNQGFLNPPINLCYLASSIEKSGSEARIIDADAERLSIPHIIKIVDDFQPDLVGITATSIDFQISETVIKHIKSIHKNLPVIIGGTHIGIFGKSVLEDSPCFDFGCVGDGENLIVEVLTCIKENKGFENVDGLVFRQNDEVIQNPDRKIFQNISEYPMPARHLLKNELYTRSVPKRGYQTTTALMSSRGCPYKCVYCAVENITSGKRVRLRTAEDVIQELVYIDKTLNIPHVAFNDDCLTINRNRIFEICEGIQRLGLKITWEGLARADQVDRELLTEMKKAGFVRISFGIESAVPHILEALNKSETVEQIAEAIGITKEVGIVTRGSVLIGSPHETRKTAKQTIRFVKKIRGLDQIVVNVLQPYPGTKVRDMVLNGENGMRFVGDQDNFHKLQRFGSASIAVNDLTPEDLVFLQKYAFLSFYLRPKVIWNNLKITGLKPFLKDGTSFIRSVVGI